LIGRKWLAYRGFFDPAVDRFQLGLPTTYVPAADPGLQIDVVPKGNS
jgi:hypothetical protein